MENLEPVYKQKRIRNILLMVLSVLVLFSSACWTGTNRQDNTVNSADKNGSSTTPITVTVSITCDWLLDHLDQTPDGVEQLIPKDGVLLAPVTVTVPAGSNAFDVLDQVCKEKNLPVDRVKKAMGTYVRAIGAIYERYAGDASGWKYQVNGVLPNIASSAYILQDGDEIIWLYTTEAGN